MSSELTVCYRGNFQPDLPAGVEPWSTEHHVALSIEELGHRVVRVQESSEGWEPTVHASHDADVFLWTQTYGYAQTWRDSAVSALRELGSARPTVGLHLDLWVGLDREHQIRDEPFFQELGWVFTADGDHDDAFAAAGVNHRWSPPAVYAGECKAGTRRSQYRSDVAFVGSWRGGYHDEWWPHRKAMLDALRHRFRRQVRFWPQRQAIRGRALNDLYASTKVVVGDSCFADRSVRYMSDRPFETVGRGGFLVMPWIEALADMLIDGEHVRYYPPGDHDELCRLVAYYLDHDDERERIRLAGQVHVAENHTYAHRLDAILQEVLA